MTEVGGTDRALLAKQQAARHGVGIRPAGVLGDGVQLQEQAPVVLKNLRREAARRNGQKWREGFPIHDVGSL